MQQHTVATTRAYKRPAPLRWIVRRARQFERVANVPRRCAIHDAAYDYACLVGERPRTTFVALRGGLHA